mmetsp:Transcript_932/g.1616  ORF Transcript_932/g.1616 Transcript_932/m.1616 type:complete len:1344 (-) Transcript_932:92-4123(-)
MQAEAQEDVYPPRPAHDVVAEPPSVTPPPLKPEVAAAHDSSDSAEERAAVPLGSLGERSQAACSAPSINEFDQYSALGVYTAVVVETERDPRATAGLMPVPSMTAGQMTSMVVEHPSTRPDRGGPELNGNSSGLRPSQLRAKRLPQPGDESQFLRVLSSYCSAITRHPCKLFVLYIALLSAFIGIMWRELDVDSHFGAFIRADGEAMRRRDAYLEALGNLKSQPDRRLQAVEDPDEDREADLIHDNLVSDEVVELRRDYGHSDETFRQLAAVVCVKRTLTILYRPKSGDAFDERVLREIREVELSLRSLSGWKRTCTDMVESEHRALCDPGISYGAFSWPTKTRPESPADEEFRISFNAQGPDLLQSPAVLTYLQSPRSDFPLDQYLPKDYEPPPRFPPDSGAPNGRPKGLRSHFLFYLTVGHEGDPMSEMRKKTGEVQNVYREVIKEEVWPLLSQRENEYINIYYYGDVISGHEVEQALQNDVMWAIASLCFVTVYLWLHTRSLFLSIMSLCIILTSVPLAYVLTPLSKTTIATFLSLFLVTGIGCDVVFVFTDFWEQSVQVERSTGRRLTWVLLHAGRNCLATSLTTSASFFANLASCLQPLREFGLFMGLAVTGAYALSVLLLPPILVIHESCCKCGSSRSRKNAESDRDAGEMDTLAIVPAGPPTLQDDILAEPKWRPRPRRKIAQIFLLALANKIAARPASVCSVALAIILVFIIGVIASYKIDRGLPDIFPEEHNQVAGNDMQEQFSVMPSDMLVSQVQGGAVCRPNGSWSNAADACILHWCDLKEVDPQQDSTSEFTCVHKEAISPSCAKLYLQTRVASPFAPDAALWKQSWTGAVQKATGSPSVSVQVDLKELKPLVLESWETGDVVTTGLYDMGQTSVQMPSPQGSSGCAIQTLCFWRHHRCSMERLHGWRSFGDFNVTAASRRLMTAVDPRGLTSALVPGPKRIDLTVVWGLRAAQSTPLVGKPEEAWSFDPRFEPDNPWAQRAMYAMCENLPSELMVFEASCWIQDFEVYLGTDRKKRFPTRDFKSEVRDWFPRTLIAQENLWKAKDDKVRAAKFTFFLNVNKNDAAGPLLEHKKKWDKYVEVMNSRAAMSGNGAWHTAQAWVRAEAEDAVVDSTVDTIIISAVCAWAGMLAFTCDPVLAFFVLGLVLGIISGLAFFMVVLVGWKIGSIEVISLVIFVGYSVTYSLHVAHTYSEAVIDDRPGMTADPEEDGLAALTDGSPNGHGDVTAPPVKRLSPADMRKSRATMSLVHIGGAVLSSAISTMGSSIFLLCCTMIIFVKLGAVVIAVTLLSVTFALMVLPAMLMLCGPPPQPWYKRWAHAVCGGKRKQSHED